MKNYFLKWPQVTDADLSGYFIDYVDLKGHTQRLVVVPKSIYALNVNLPFGIKKFYVKAFDVAGNVGPSVEFKGQ